MEYCICGHDKEFHKYVDEILPDAPHVGVCRGCPSMFDHLHEFKLDNLKLIEDLANQKGLI